MKKSLHEKNKQIKAWNWSDDLNYITSSKDFIYRNELDKACFQRDMAYSKSKDLGKRTQSDKVLRDKAFKNCKLSKIWWLSKRSSFNGLQVFW